MTLDASITHEGMGPASLGEQNVIGLGVVVVVVVGGPVYIHFLEYEFSDLNFINNGTNISGKSNQGQVFLFFFLNQA